MSSTISLLDPAPSTPAEKMDLRRLKTISELEDKLCGYLWDLRTSGRSYQGLKSIMQKIADDLEEYQYQIRDMGLICDSTPLTPRMAVEGAYYALKGLSALCEAWLPLIKDAQIYHEIQLLVESPALSDYEKVQA